MRIGPVDDWVRTVAAHLRADPVTVGAEPADLDPLLEDGSVLLSCGVPGLHAVLLRLIRRDLVATTPLGWVPDADGASRELAGWLHLPARPTLAADVAVQGTPREVRLVRDDHGGLLLHRGRLSAWRGGRFGGQSWHDDQRAADGPLRRVDVRPDYAADCAVVAEVRAPDLLRRVRTTRGRSVQTACDEARAAFDGLTHPRPVTRWTWYADPRQHWLLRSP